MIMDRKVRRSTFVGGEEDPQTSSENGPDSPLSGDERATAPSPKKRRSIQKRVVQVPIADVEGSSSSRSGRGEAYPPSDSWAWRKYGQKPIKGSPYPRGYYRCSSSKGCPARKQVERSRLDPTQLIITYASDHNHPHPTSSSSSSKHHNNNNSNSAPPAAVNPPSPPTPTSPSTSKDNTTTTIEQDHHNPVDDDDDDKTAGCLFAGPSCCDLDLDLGDEDNSHIMDFNWLSDVAFESAPSFVGPRCIDVVADVGVINISSTTITTSTSSSNNNNNVIKMREEDEKLFADLDELPECSAVFRHGGGRPFDRCNLGPTATAAPVCGGTG